MTPGKLKKFASHTGSYRKMFTLRETRRFGDNLFTEDKIMKRSTRCLQNKRQSIKKFDDEGVLGAIPSCDLINASNYSGLSIHHLRYGVLS